LPILSSVARARPVQHPSGQVDPTTCPPEQRRAAGQVMRRVVTVLMLGPMPTLASVPCLSLMALSSWHQRCNGQTAGRRARCQVVARYRQSGELLIGLDLRKSSPIRLQSISLRPGRRGRTWPHSAYGYLAEVTSLSTCPTCR
jgi:hypothetical protein